MKTEATCHKIVPMSLKKETFDLHRANTKKRVSQKGISLHSFTAWHMYKDV